MKAALFVISTSMMMPIAEGALNVVPAEVATCNIGTDCDTHDTAGGGTCAPGSGGALCTCPGNLFTAGGNTLNMCKGAATPNNAKMTVHYALRNIGATGRVIDCNKATTFTPLYDDLIREAAAAFEADDLNTMEIVHLCNKPTMVGGAHVLHTSVRVDVVIDKFLTVAAYTTLPSLINDKLAASTDDGLNSVGRVESALAFRDAALSRYCTQTNGVYVPFATTLGAIGTNECKAVSCGSGYDFDRTEASPSCSGPGRVATDEISTCGVDGDCGNGDTCSGTTYTCTTCSIVVSGGNSLKRCGTVTDTITLHYVFSHGTLPSDASKAVDCFGFRAHAPYEVLVKAVEPTATVFTICEGGKLRSVITLRAKVSDVLSAGSRYTSFALDVNQQLIDSNDANLKPVGGIGSVHVGTDESLHQLCPSSDHVTLSAPLSFADHLHETADRRRCVSVRGGVPTGAA